MYTTPTYSKRIDAYFNFYFELKPNLILVSRLPEYSQTFKDEKIKPRS